MHTTDYNLIARRITFPYLPLLGPIHPQEISQQLICNIFNSSETDTVLPHDKQIRWGRRPNERIVSHNIVDKSVTIQTESNSKNFLYIYGPYSGSMESSISTIITFSKKARTLQLLERCSVIYIDTYNEDIINASPYIYAYQLNSDEQNEIANLGDKDSMSGFRYLLDNGRLQDTNSPTIVIKQDGIISGAIGPHTILNDSLGVKRLLPCYFGVSQTARRQGIGKRLWNQSRYWASSHGAEYALLQADYDSPAAYFYEAVGLKKIGYVYRRENTDS